MAKRWTPREDAMVLGRKVPDAVLVVRLKRYDAAIKCRRHFLLHPKTVRRQRKESSARYHDQGLEGAVRNGLPWKEWENKLVLAKAMPDAQIAKRLKRSIQSVQTQRWELKLETKREHRRSA